MFYYFRDQHATLFYLYLPLSSLVLNVWTVTQTMHRMNRTSRILSQRPRSTVAHFLGRKLSRLVAVLVQFHFGNAENLTRRARRPDGCVILEHLSRQVQVKIHVH